MFGCGYLGPARFNRQRGLVLLRHQKYPKVLVAKMGLFILFGFSFISSLYLRGVYIMAQPFLFCRWSRPENEYDMMLFAKCHPLQLIGKTIRHAVICEHQWNNGKRLNINVGHDISGALLWRRLINLGISFLFDRTQTLAVWIQRCCLKQHRQDAERRILSVSGFSGFEDEQDGEMFPSRMNLEGLCLRKPNTESRVPFSEILLYR